MKRAHDRLGVVSSLSWNNGVSTSGSISIILWTQTFRGMRLCAVLPPRGGSPALGGGSITCQDVQGDSDRCKEACLVPPPPPSRR
jgi:hypothetical protein